MQITKIIRTQPTYSRQLSVPTHIVSLKEDAHIFKYFGVHFSIYNTNEYFICTSKHT